MGRHLRFAGRQPENDSPHRRVEPGPAAQSANVAVLIRRFLGNRSANIAIVAGLSLPALIGFAGLGTEAGLWYWTDQQMQGAADSAAISAATAYGLNSSANLTTQGSAVAASYNFTAANGSTIAVHQPPTSGTHTTSPGAVEVVISQPQIRLISALWDSSPLSISARAVAVANGGLGCVLALDPTAPAAVSSQGSSGISLSGCSLYSNSSDPTSVSVGGSATISALSVGVVGGVSGSSNITTTQGISTGRPPIPDPYAGVSIPAFTGCDQTNFSTNGIATLNPGVYCGGITAKSTAVVTLNPGTYYLDGGGLTMHGSASLTGTGVTLVFTSSSNSYACASIDGGATLNLTAPATGPFAGIAIYGDRNMPTGTSCKVSGGTGQTIGGVIYLPKAAVQYAGGTGTGTNCTQLIADTVSFVGNSSLQVNCAAYGTKAIGTLTASLVE